MSIQPPSDQTLYYIDRAIRRYATLMRGCNAAQEIVEQRLNGNEVTKSPTEIVILHALYSTDDNELSVKDLCDITGLPRSTMNGILTTSEIGGDIVRTRRGRTTTTVLTAEGERFISEFRTTLAENHQGLLEQAANSGGFDDDAVTKFFLLPAQAAEAATPKDSFARKYLELPN